MQMTLDAAAYVDECRRRRNLTDSMALRIWIDADDLTLKTAFVERPAEGDESVVLWNVRVFVAADLAEALEDSLLELDSTGPTRLVVVTRERVWA